MSRPNGRRGATARAVLSLALSLALVDGARATATALPTTTLNALRASRADDAVRAAFIGADAPGALVVRGVSDAYVDARRRGLRAFAECAASTEGATDGESPPLTRSDEWARAHDGASRTTIASMSSARLRFDIDDACGEAAGVRADLEIIRDAADDVASAALARLDAAFHNATGGFYERSARSDTSLDHFHAYGAPSVELEARTEDVSAETEGKHAHTDVGVAIVMTPALLLDEKPGASGSRGLFIGDIEPDVPDDGIIVMLGEAARAWVPGLSEEMRSLLKVPTHAMRLTGDRAWFGRMVLPQSTTAHPTADVTFGTWHEGAIRAAQSSNEAAESERWAAVACQAPVFDSPTVASRRRRLQSDNTCGTGQIYCWLSCVAAPDCGSDTAQCIDSATGQAWINAPNNHCNACTAQCPATNYPSSSGMCNKRLPPTTMYMDGFKWTTGGSSQPCTALLFKSWSLHTPGLLALGFFFTVAMGASIEAMASIRRKLQNTGFCNCHNIPPTKSRAYSVGIYAVQVTVGYLLMLISMTYNFVLFSSVVVGLVIGHLCFGASAPVTATTSACCTHVSPSDKQDCPGCAPSAPASGAADLPSCCAARDDGSSGAPSSSGDSLKRPLSRDVESAR